MGARGAHCASRRSGCGLCNVALWSGVAVFCATCVMVAPTPVFDRGGGVSKLEVSERANSPTLSAPCSLRWGRSQVGLIREGVPRPSNSRAVLLFLKYSFVCGRARSVLAMCALTLFEYMCMGGMLLG